MVRQAADILDGIHPAWAPLMAVAGRAYSPGPPSALLQSHVEDLIRYGAAAPVPRGAPALIARMFLTHKSDGVTSRPILDARPQNQLVDQQAIARRRFRLLQPLAHVRVGVGLGVEGQLGLYEADAVSYFPSFR